MFWIMMQKNPQWCSYYQATIRPADVWFFAATLRSCDHMAFDRTLDTARSLFEFFVPPAYEQEFLDFMRFFIDKSLVTNLKKIPNRLQDSTQTI